MHTQTAEDDGNSNDGNGTVQDALTKLTFVHHHKQ